MVAVSHQYKTNELSTIIEKLTVNEQKKHIHTLRIIRKEITKRVNCKTNMRCDFPSDI